MSKKLQELRPVAGHEELRPYRRDGMREGSEVAGKTDKSSALALVSVIVPVYNGEKYLRESLDSILAQTYQHTEVLVMDDCSTDGTPAILESYGDRVRIFRQPHNRGIYGNANDGVAMAQGKYIAIYHA